MTTQTEPATAHAAGRNFLPAHAIPQNQNPNQPMNKTCPIAKLLAVALAVVVLLIATPRLMASEVLVSKNLGAGAYLASATLSTNTPDRAFDGTTNTLWNAGAVPTQWIEVDLGANHSLTRCILRVAQSPSGITRHYILASTNPIAATAIGTVHSFLGITTNGQTLERVFPSPLNARYLQIRTDLSPSWVAWSEIEVYATTGVPPHVVVQPLNQNLYEGRNGALAATTTGSGPLAYQWLHNGTNVLNATNGVLNFNSLSANDSGTYQAIITNTFGSTTSQVATLTVLPPPRFTLTLATNLISEAANPAEIIATLTRDADFSTPVTVMLTNSDQTEISVPASVILPAGSNSVTFALQVANDGEVDGTQAVSVSAGAPFYVGGSVTLQVADDDLPNDRTLGGTLFGSIAQNNYRVLTDVVVPANQTLTIEAGSLLMFETNTGVTVDGTLIATGGLSSKIVFTCQASPAVHGGWDGISVNGGGSRTLLAHVEIAYATTGISISGFLPRVTLTDGELHHCSALGMLVAAGPGSLIAPSDIVVTRNSVHHCDFGIWIDAFASSSGASANPTVEENDIFNNRYGIQLRSNGAFFTSGYADARGQIARNVLRENSNAAIAGYALAFRTGVNASFINNLIINNIGNGIELSGSGSPILNNTIVGNGGLGFSHSSYGGFFQNNIVVSNQVGVQSAAPFTPFAGQFGFNDVALNGSGNWSNFPPAFGSATTNNFNGTSVDSENNISVNPQFVSSTDFHLLATSPALNAGTTNAAPTTDFEGQPRFAPFDIGADEVQPRFQFGAPSRQANGLLQWPVAVQAAYVFTIQSSTNLNTWNNVAVVTNNGGTVTFSIHPTNSALGFFRAVP